MHRVVCLWPQHTSWKALERAGEAYRGTSTAVEKIQTLRTMESHLQVLRDRVEPALLRSLEATEKPPREAAPAHTLTAFSYNLSRSLLVESTMTRVLGFREEPYLEEGLLETDPAADEILRLFQAATSPRDMPSIERGPDSVRIGGVELPVD